MDARIVDGRKIAKVTSEGRLLVEPTVLRGTYDGEPVDIQVTQDGKLVISAAVHVGDVTATIGEIEAKGSPDDGVTWVPVRVDADGRLEVQLSGNIVASETLFPEETRAATTGYSTLQSCPNGARGFAISLTIRGVTGTFGSGEGVGLNVRIRNDADKIIFNQLTEKTNVLNCCHVVTMYPGLQAAPSPIAGSRLVHINAFSIGSVDAQIQVKGTFAEGEGIACSAKIIWLL